MPAATPAVALPRREMPVVNRRNDVSTPASAPLPAVAIARPSAEEVARAVPEVQKRREAASRAGSSGATTGATSLPPADLRLGTSRERLVMSIARPPAASAPAAALPVERALPGERRPAQADAQPLADLTGSTSGSRLTEVPSFYRAAARRQPFLAGPSRRCQHRQRASRGTCPRLARPPPRR